MESTKYPAADTEAPRRWAWRRGQRKVGRWLIQLSQVAERVPSRSYPALPAASGEFCKENPFSRIKLKQREAKKALKIRCAGEIGEIFQRITRPTVNSPTLRKKVEEQSRHGKKVKVLNPRSFAHLQVLMMFPNDTQIVIISVTSR